MLSIRNFQVKLLKWYQQYHRNLPWRSNPDPYSVWLSEVMLQQTQVKTMLPYYERFKKRFPSLQLLAKANIEQVLPYWAGLGYYQRIRNFHQAVQIVMKEFMGQIPSTRETLLVLPGVGDYIANAVASIAFNQPVAVIDGNVERVYSRYLAWQEDIKSSKARKFLIEISQQYLHKKKSGDFNQAIMELGALICVPKNPQCHLCPVRPGCLGFKQDIHKDLPNRLKKIQRKKVLWASLWLQMHNKILLEQRSNVSVMTGLWQLPTLEIKTTSQIRSSFEKRLKIKLQIWHPKGIFQHSIMNQNIKNQVFQAEMEGDFVLKSKDFKWISLDQVQLYAITGITKKILKNYFKANSNLF